MFVYGEFVGFADLLRYRCLLILALFDLLGVLIVFSLGFDFC